MTQAEYLHVAEYLCENFAALRSRPRDAESELKPSATRQLLPLLRSAPQGPILDALASLLRSVGVKAGLVPPDMVLDCIRTTVQTCQRGGGPDFDWPVSLGKLEHGTIVIYHGECSMERLVVREVRTPRGRETLAYGRLEGPSEPVRKCRGAVSQKRLWIWGYCFNQRELAAIDPVDESRAQEITQRWREWAKAGVLVNLVGKRLKPDSLWSEMSLNRAALAHAMMPGIPAEWKPPPKPADDDFLADLEEAVRGEEKR